MYETAPHGPCIDCNNRKCSVYLRQSDCEYYGSTIEAFAITSCWQSLNNKEENEDGVESDHRYVSKANVEEPISDEVNKVWC